METKDFAYAFIGRLADDRFHNDGSLAAYLALPDSLRSGDEANIIDARVTRILIEALGYVSAETDYNKGKDNLRPDYVIRIRSYPSSCFVVEDKATTERRLDQHRKQLFSYMALNRSPRGLLVNGFQLLGYDDMGPLATATLELSLYAAVRLWRGEDLLAGGKTGWSALPQAEQDALAVLLRRYGREAFEGVTRLVDDLTLDRDGEPHAANGSSWVAGRTRLVLTDAHAAPDQLVEAVIELVGGIREDVAVQYAARQREHELFLAEIARAPGSEAAAAEVMENIVTGLLALLPPAAEERRDSLRTRLRQALRGERPQTEIDDIAAEVRLEARQKSLPRMNDPVSKIALEARAFASRYSRHLLKAQERHRAAIEAIEAYDRWRAAVGVLLLAGASPQKA